MWTRQNGLKLLLETSGRGIDAVHFCGASGFLGFGLGWLRRLLLLRLAGFVRVMTSAVGHDFDSFEWTH